MSECRRDFSPAFDSPSRNKIIKFVNRSEQGYFKKLFENWLRVVWKQKHSQYTSKKLQLRLVQPTEEEMKEEHRLVILAF